MGSPIARVITQQTLFCKAEAGSCMLYIGQGESDARLAKRLRDGDDNPVTKCSWRCLVLSLRHFKHLQNKLASK